MTNAVLRTLLAELDGHSPGEADHGERVSVYSVAAAHRMEFGSEELQRLRFASALHDFGKLGIESELLRWPGPLSAAQARELRRHPALANRLLEERGFSPYPEIESHHERWDGSGYPRRLAGAEIPLPARIIAVAEAWDVVSYGTFWRPRMQDVEAIEWLRSGAGKAFDPEVVTAFLAVQPVIQPVGT
jgi:HD-GYP domain-containing protein (c-di-GMP phosphodiesterase class II)